MGAGREAVSGPAELGNLSASLGSSGERCGKESTTPAIITASLLYRLVQFASHPYSCLHSSKRLRQEKMQDPFVPAIAQGADFQHEYKESTPPLPAMRVLHLIALLSLSDWWHFAILRGPFLLFYQQR